MADFCLDCWNKINGTNDNKSKYILSRDLDFCEGCGELKRVIIMEREAYFEPMYVRFEIIYNLFGLVWKLLTLPYSLFKKNRRGR